ncbi:MAG: acetyl-CoA carboxylase carboxyl transferase subunit alpha, partial [Pseudomonadota bacterium]
LTAQDLHELGVADRIVPEPTGGAQRHRNTVIASAGEAIGEMLDELAGMDGPALVADRRRKFLETGGKWLAA